MSLKSLSPYLLLVAAGGAFLVYYNGGVPGIRKDDRPISSLTSADRELVSTAAGTRQGTQQAAPRRTGSDGPQVDESAIYYYAAQRDWERMRAEIERLRALYPNWVPPENPELGQSSVDPELQQFWALFAEGKYPAVRDAIAKRQQSDPDWTPPAELTSKLAEAEARLRLVNAGKAEQWATVLRVANENSGLLTCANVEALWTVAEAFVKTDEATRGLDVYKYVLDNCTNGEERLATIEKAVGILPLAEAEQLVASNTGEAYDNARDTLVRRRVGEAAQDSGKTASAPDLARMEQIVSASDVTADDAMLLAFYLYSHGDPARAAQMFKIALDKNGGAKAGEGYVLAMHAQERFLEAEPVAYEWRDSDADNMKAYLDLMTAALSQEPPLQISEAVIQHFVPVVVKQQSSLGGQALGWYAYNTGQIENAERWFIQALKWDRDSEPSAYGLAIARQRLKNARGFAAVVNAWRSRSDRIDDLARGINRHAPRPTDSGGGVAQRQEKPVSVITDDDRELFGATPTPGASAARSRGGDNAQVFTASSSTPAVPPAAAARRAGSRCATASSLNDLQRLSASAAMSLGWCLMDLDRPLEAARAFDAAMERSTTAKARGEAAYGKSYAYLRAGLTSKATVAASNAQVSTARQRELRIALLTQQAGAAYSAGRYADAIFSLDARSQLAPEQTDLMMLRAWAYVNLGRLDEAERIFKLVQRTGGSRDAATGLSVITEKRGLNRY